MKNRRRWIWKPVVFLACLGPLLSLIYRFRTDDLGVNPVEFITHATGDWTIRILLLSLAITPLRRWFGWNELIAYRRMLGLFAFFYGCLHFAIWFWLDKSLDPAEMWADIVKRRFITAGMLGLVIMVLLAITSTKGWIRRMGRNWTRLHKFVYLSAIAGVVHYWWLVKSDIRLPALYGAITAMLLGARAWAAWRKTAVR